MIGFRKIVVAFIAIGVLGAGIAATTPHNWGQDFGVAATESGVCAFNNVCP